MVTAAEMIASSDEVRDLIVPISTAFGIVTYSRFGMHTLVERMPTRSPVLVTSHLHQVPRLAGSCVDDDEAAHQLRHETGRTPARSPAPANTATALKAGDSEPGRYDTRR